MNHREFKIGLEFQCGIAKWRCTDIGTRTIVAIRITPFPEDEILRDDTWLDGPPYLVEELVFDELDIVPCKNLTT